MVYHGPGGGVVTVVDGTICRGNFFGMGCGYRRVLIVHGCRCEFFFWLQRNSCTGNGRRCCVVGALPFSSQVERRHLHHWTYCHYAKVSYFPSHFNYKSYYCEPSPFQGLARLNLGVFFATVGFSGCCLSPAFSIILLSFNFAPNEFGRSSRGD